MSTALIATACVCCGGQNLDKSPAILMPFVAHRAFGWAPVTIDASWGLKTVPEGRAYSLCNSLLCRDCGLVFLDIRFDNYAMAKLYENYRGEAYTLLRDSYEPGYRLRNEGFQYAVTYLSDIEDFLRPLLPKLPKILDWGGDTGINTPFKLQSDCIHVFDISAVSPLPGVVRVNLEEVMNNRYDLLVCSNVLEHTPYPAAVLDEISRVMDEDAVLYLEVPHEAHMRNYSTGFERLKAKRHWHEHVNFYTASALESLIHESGFDVIRFEERKFVLDAVEFHQFFVACKLTRS